MYCCFSCCCFCAAAVVAAAVIAAAAVAAAFVAAADAAAFVVAAAAAALGRTTCLAPSSGRTLSISSHDESLLVRTQLTHSLTTDSLPLCHAR